MNYDEIIAIIMLIIYGIPYVFILRILWYLGTFLKNKVKNKIDLH